MAQGVYLFVDTRQVPKKRGPGAGTDLDEGLILKVLELVKRIKLKENNKMKVTHSKGLWGDVRYEIFPSPPERLNKTDILGPPVSEVTSFCKNLPYYKFRLSAMPEWEHKYECDRNIIRRKPSNRYTYSLLKEFIS